MENHAEKAARLFREGCNCAQSVFLAFTDLTGMDDALALRLAAPFGGGMGRLRETCGGVTGALMTLGILCAPQDPTDRDAKAAHYALVQELARRFRDQHGTLLCHDLLGDLAGSGFVPEARTDEYYKKRPCEQLVYSGAANLETLLQELGKL